MRRRAALVALLLAALAVAAPGALAGGPLAGRVVTIDPGHDGGNGAHPEVIGQQVWAGNRWKDCDTTGTATNDGYSESAYNWDVARRTAAVLRGLGARVVLTRHGDRGVGPCIDRRARIGNRAGSDAVVSIHADGNDSADARGFHVIRPLLVAGYNDGTIAPSRRLARSLRDAFARGTGMPVSTYAGSAGLVARDDLGGLNLTRVPKVFIETGNMRHPRDARLLSSAAWRARAARAIARGIAAFVVAEAERTG